MTLNEFIAAKLREAIAGAIKDVQDELTAVAEAGGKAGKGGLFGDVKSITGILSDIAGPLADVVAFAFPPVEVLKTVEDAGGDAASGFGAGYFMGYAAWQMLSPFVLPLQHAVGDLAQTEIFDPNTAAGLEAQGIIDNAYGRSEAAGGNLSGEHYDKLVESQLDRPALAQLLDMWNRGLVNEPDVDKALRHHRIPEFWWQPLKMLRRTLLSPADLALNNLRGFISDQDAQQYAAVTGMIPADFARLVENTGEPPGPEQLMEAMRRGFINQQEFEHGIRQSRIRNEWIPTMERLRYEPMTTADAVRAVVEGHIPDEKGAAIADQNGLEAEHWPILVQAWGRPPSHEQMMELYHRGLVSLEQVKQAILESDIKNKYVDELIQLGRQLIPQRQVTQMLQHGVITRERALTMLTDLGYTHEDADAYIRLGEAEHKTTLHTLTRTDITTAYEDRLMTRKEAIDHLIKLGYTQQDATELLDLADTKAAQATIRSIKSGVEASLKAHHITQDEATQQLVKAGIDPQQARQLTDLWLQVRGTPSRGLTEAQILKLGEAGLLTVDQTRARLIGLGLTRGDADLLLTLHGLEAAGGIVRGGQQPIINAPPKATP